MQLLASEINVDYYIHLPGIVSLLMLIITYIQAMALYIHIHTAHSLYKIMDMATSVVGVMKVGHILPRAGLEPTSLAFQASVLPLHHIGSLMSPLYPRPLVYAAPCLRGQCSLLQY